jgi:hypothetical protein
MPFCCLLNRMDLCGVSLVGGKRMHVSEFGRKRTFRRPDQAKTRFDLMYMRVQMKRHSTPYIALQCPTIRQKFDTSLLHSMLLPIYNVSLVKKAEIQL